MIIAEMVVQRDLLFRKNTIARNTASQVKRECAASFRRLSSENSQLISEMNNLRQERKSFQKSCKELESKLMTVCGGAKGLAELKLPGGGNMAGSASAPDLQAAQGGKAAPGKTANAAPRSDATPYIKRKTA